MEQDYIEAIVALPTDIFFRTGIGTYLWLLTNKKSKKRKGKVQLIDATAIHSPMRKSEGNKRRRISDEQIHDIAHLYADFESAENVRIVDYRDFGYRRIKVQRPLRLVIHVTAEAIDALKASKPFAKLDETEQTAWLRVLAKQNDSVHPYEWLDTLVESAKKAGVGKVGNPLLVALETVFGVRDANAPPVLDEDGAPRADKELEDFENVPLQTPVVDYMEAKVLPHVPDAWVDESYVDERDGGIGKVGYEINFNRYFYKYQPPRDLHEIDAELKAVEKEIAALLDEVAE